MPLPLTAKFQVRCEPSETTKVLSRCSTSLTMNTLPPEILCDIFLKCLPSVYNERNIPYSESISSPLRISHVCRTWREISLSCRELWSYLCIRHGFFSDRGKLEMMVEIFDTWLARTNDGPLNFVIESVSKHGSIQDHRSAEHIITTLIKNQHRWKDVYFYCFDVVFSSEFPGFNLTNTPIMTSLNFTLDRSLRATADFTQSSHLRTLKINHNNFDLLAGGGLSRLEYVDLTISPNEKHHQDNIRHFHLCLNILRNAPSLRYFSVYTASDPSSTPLILDEECIPPAGLRDLVLWEDKGSLIPVTVVDAMTLPNLERFRYYSEVGSESLSRFFQRSLPPLASLEIYYTGELEDKLIGILRLLPSLKKLILDDVELSDSLFHELTVTNDADDDGSVGREQIVCPRLSFFVGYRLHWETDNWSEILFNMAKSRASVLGTFKTVSFGEMCFDLRTTEVTDIGRVTHDPCFTLAGT